jgi:hypothetical protein
MRDRRRRDSVGPARSRPTAEIRPASGSDPDVPRDRGPAPLRAVPRPVRVPARARGAGADACDSGVRGGDARPGLRRVARTREAPAAPGRPLVRRRLPQPGHRCTADPRGAALARRAQSRAGEPRPFLGRRSARRPTAHGRGLGDRRAHADASGSHHPERFRAQARGRGLPGRDPAPLRRDAAVLLLPGGALRRGRPRRRAGGRL